LLKGKIDPVYSRTLADLVKKFKFEKHHGKIDILDSLVNNYLNEEKEKLVIFDFHPRTIDLLSERYSKYNPITIHGNTEKTQEERDAKIERFKQDKDSNLLVGSFRVMSTAINLTECSRVIYFSRDFSYTNWSQSIKRFHRIGQSKRVIINPIIFEESLDEYIEKALIQKTDLDEKLFQKETLSKDEWKNIFKGDV